MKHLILPGLILILGVWFSSGTMAPYAATVKSPVVTPECQYFVSSDHGHFEATFELLKGESIEKWGSTSALRRILFPLFAYPWMKFLGFDLGGLLASAFMQLSAFIFWVLFVRSRYGTRAAVLSAWLLATYPGIHYWAGLPYSYSAIVPCCLGLMMLLIQLSSVTTKKQTCWISFFMGTLCLGYDLLPYFGLAAVMVLWLSKRKAMIPAFTLISAIPSLIVIGWISFLGGVHSGSGNLVIYYRIARGFLEGHNLFIPWQEVLHLPAVFISVYFFSGMFFLPTLFLLIFLFWGQIKKIKLNSAEISVLFSIGIFFLINNLVRSPDGWQMRGAWLARLYQPVFVVFLSYLARISSEPLKKPVLALFILTCLANASVVFGSFFRVPYASPIYYYFYAHSIPGQMDGSFSGPQVMRDNLDKYGRRPFGFCKHS